MKLINITEAELRCGFPSADTPTTAATRTLSESVQLLYKIMYQKTQCDTINKYLLKIKQAESCGVHATAVICTKICSLRSVFSNKDLFLQRVFSFMHFTTVKS